MTRIMLYERVKFLEDFYLEFREYAKAKKSLQNKKIEEIPEGLLKGYYRRLDIINNFEKKYLTREN